MCVGAILVCIFSEWHTLLWSTHTFPPSANTALWCLKVTSQPSRCVFSPLCPSSAASQRFPPSFQCFCQGGGEEKKNFVDTNASLANCNLLSCLSQPFPKWKNKLRRVIFLDNGRSCFEIYRNWKLSSETITVLPVDLRARASATASFLDCLEWSDSSRQVLNLRRSSAAV